MKQAIAKPAEKPQKGSMTIDAMRAKRAAMKTAINAPAPINPKFISLAELLLRVQTSRISNLTLTEAAHGLLHWGFESQGAPAWRCNSKTRGIVTVNALQAEVATNLLKFVCVNGQLASDEGHGASTDYELFGFDRKEFSDFLSSVVGEPIDLFCAIPEPSGASNSSEIPTSSAADADSQDQNLLPGDKPNLESSLSTGEVAYYFRDIHFTQEQWSNNLNDPSPWLKNCQTQKGKRGNQSTQALWNPVEIAKGLTTNARVAPNKAQRETNAFTLNGRFVKETKLEESRAAWGEFFSMMFGNESTD